MILSVANYVTFVDTVNIVLNTAIGANFPKI